MSDSTPPPPATPRWNTPTKFLVALVFLVLIGWFLIQFQSLWGPMIAVIILAYLLGPVVGWVSRLTRLPWGTAVLIVYLVLVSVIIGLLVVAGVAIQRQILGLYDAVVGISGDLPGYVTELLSRPIAVGPFTIDPATINFEPILQQLASAIQPALSQTGTFVSSLATGTAVGVGWLFFVVILSYYLLADLGQVVTSVEQRVPPDYREDARRLASRLGPIWNNYLRGQVTLSGLLGIMVGIVLSILGVSYAPVLGLLAFVLDFIPYIGATISLATGFLVALFQGGNWLGIDQFYFALIVAAAYLILQQIQGYVLWPRIMGGSLNLHPLVILVGALVMAQLVGPVGLVLAGPLIATLSLFGRYAYCKLFDMDPWEGLPAVMRPAPPRKPLPKLELPLRRKTEPPAPAPPSGEAAPPTEQTPTQS